MTRRLSFDRRCRHPVGDLGLIEADASWRVDRGRRGRRDDGCVGGEIPGHARSEPVGKCAAASNGASSSTDVPINVVMPVVILMWFMVEFSVLGSMVVSS